MQESSRSHTPYDYDQPLTAQAIPDLLAATVEMSKQFFGAEAAQEVRDRAVTADFPDPADIRALCDARLDDDVIGQLVSRAHEIRQERIRADIRATRSPRYVCYALRFGISNMFSSLRHPRRD